MNLKWNKENTYYHLGERQKQKQYIYDLNLLAKWKHMIALLAKNLILSVSISNAKSVESDHTFDKIFKGSPQLLPFPSCVPPVSEIAYFWPNLIFLRLVLCEQNAQ